MKKTLLLIVTILFVNLSFAAIIQVDNNAGASAEYATLQQGIDNANNGDTIYVAGSPFKYDGTTLIRLNKTLTIIGPGYFLGENGQTQASNLTAKIYDIEIGEGADNSILMGLDFYYSGQEIFFSKDKRDGSVGTAPANNVVLKRNLIESLEINYAHGTIIEQNYFKNTNNNLYLDETCSGSLIQNNIFISGSSYATIYGRLNYQLSNTVIKNNTLSNSLYRIHGVEISNNIIVSGILNDCDNNTVKNNVFVNAESVSIPTESEGNTTTNNKFSVTASELFVETTPTVDNDYMLKATSPAVGAGIGGIDAGASGGINAYKLSGLPPIPSVYEISTNGVGTKEGGLSISIKAKSNN